MVFNKYHFTNYLQIINVLKLKDQDYYNKNDCQLYTGEISNKYYACKCIATMVSISGYYILIYTFVISNTTK